MPTRRYHVPEITCHRCQDAIQASVVRVPGVERVEVDIDTRRVTVTGDAPDETVRAAIEDAGYDVAGDPLA